MTFSLKKIRITFRSEDDFYKDDADSFQIDGATIRASITVLPTGESTLEAFIYGLPLDMINRLTKTRAGTMLGGQNMNYILLEMVDGDKISFLYGGGIVTAFADFNVGADVVFNVAASASYKAQLSVKKPISFVGSTPVSQVFKVIADTCGFNLVDYGVEGYLTDPVFNLSPWQMFEALRDANRQTIMAWIEGDTIHIAPWGTVREVEEIEISRYTGMIGYPVPIDDGVKVSCLFNQRYQLRHPVKLYTEELERLNGDYVIYALRHSIEAGVPDGKWFTDMSLGYNITKE